MATNRPALDIVRSLRGERIFITGATGFIGKVLVEKLLWSVPEVGRLILLVRPDGERPAAHRLREEILGSPAMGRLRALHGDDWEAWAAGKIEVVAGDLGRERCGLSPAAWAALAARVDRVVASAATVAFDERLDRALALNARGALRTLELARDAGGAPLVHLSTCFVSGRRRGSVAEAVAAPEPTGTADPDPGPLLAALDEAVREAGGPAALAAAGAAMAERYGFHDVYTLTKALGERLLERERGAVPLAIVRPAIVESALAEPLPGWIEAVRVADPLLVAYARGQARELPGDPGARLDVVPVDLVVNATIAALAELRPGRDMTGRDVPRVYHVSSSRHPIALGQLVEHARQGFARAPLRDARGRAIRVRRARYADPLRWLEKLRARRALALGLARRLPATGLGRRLGAAARKLAHFARLLEIYRPYLDHGARYDDGATRALWSRMSPEERSAFPFDVAAIDWRSYVAGSHVPGLVRFALKAEDGLPPARTGDAARTRRHPGGEIAVAAASTLHELLAGAAAADPRGIAFQTCRNGRWLRYTYEQALTAVRNIAWRLATRHGIGPGDRVVLWGRSSPEWVLTSFAVQRLGAATVPLDPQWPAAEVAAAARFTAARLVCAAPELRAALAGAALPAALPTVALAEPFVPGPGVGLLPGAEKIEATGDGDGLATILFTSGTTVEPKAVPLTHRNLLANVRDLAAVMSSSRERLLSVLPLHHAFELTVGLLVPLAGNGTVSYVDRLEPAEIRWMMTATRPTMLVAVPRLLELLHDGIQRNLAAGGPWRRGFFRLLFALSAATGGRCGHVLFAGVHRRFGGALRRVATGGAALPPALGRSFRLMGIRVAEGYGMTETSPVIAVNPWHAIRPGSVGRPLAGVEVEVRPAANGGGSGEIRVRGASVMAGYYRNPRASAEVLRDGWLATGDLGFFDRDGYLHLVGRSKDVIVTAAGKNVYPEEVERRYRDLPGVAELVVLGLPGPRGERVAAVVVPQAEAGGEDVRAAIAARSAGIPSYQQISHVEIWRGDLPKTTTLKVKRGRLRDALLAGETGGDGGRAVAPGARPAPAAAAASPGIGNGADERRILAVLARLTRSRPDAVSASDRLTELGVDSLTRVELVSELEGRFGLAVDDEAAAALATVRDVLDLVAGRRSGRLLPGDVRHRQPGRRFAAAGDGELEDLVDVAFGDAGVPDVGGPHGHGHAPAAVLEAPGARDHHPVANPELPDPVLEAPVDGEPAAGRAARLGGLERPLVGADEDLDPGGRQARRS
ncbi:MAG: AMP-binding protein [Acidobacteriota bacterium]|nr:AMP-binding protein [Acidobacteriota bacterium]